MSRWARRGIGAKIGGRRRREDWSSLLLPWRMLGRLSASLAGFRAGRPNSHVVEFRLVFTLLTGGSAEEDHRFLMEMMEK